MDLDLPKRICHFACPYVRSCGEDEYSCSQREGGANLAKILLVTPGLTRCIYGLGIPEKQPQNSFLNSNSEPFDPTLRYPPNIAPSAEHTS